MRLNFSVREIEISGSDACVHGWYDRLNEVVQHFLEAPAIRANPADKQPLDDDDSAEAGRIDANTASFGEFLQRYPDDITDVDRMLVAGFFIQKAADDDSFKTNDANQLLLQQGFRISNPSECVRRNASTRRLFTVKKGVYRVSDPGRRYLQELAND